MRIGQMWWVGREGVGGGGGGPDLRQFKLFPEDLGVVNGNYVIIQSWDVLKTHCIH